jgi:hypothetical protein
MISLQSATAMPCYEYGYGHNMHRVIQTVLELDDLLPFQVNPKMVMAVDS